MSDHYLFRGIAAKVVAANRDLAFAAQQVTVAIIAAPRTFRRGLAAKFGGLDAAHAVRTYLALFAQRHLAGRSVAAESGG